MCFLKFKNQWLGLVSTVFTKMVVTLTICGKRGIYTFYYLDNHFMSLQMKAIIIRVRIYVSGRFVSMYFIYTHALDSSVGLNPYVHDFFLHSSLGKYATVAKIFTNI